MKYLLNWVPNMVKLLIIFYGQFTKSGDVLVNRLENIFKRNAKAIVHYRNTFGYFR